MKLQSLKIIDHPVAKAYLTKIRDRNTSHFEFSQFVERLSMLLAYEASSGLKTKSKKIHTPLAPYKGVEIKQEIILLPILRAGLGLLGGFSRLFPDAKISHLGIYRDEETLLPVKYYFKFPELKNSRNASVFILDPMLATGGSMNFAINEVKIKGIRTIVVCSLVSAPEGVNEVLKLHPDIKIYTCSLDKKLNDKGYIIPGLGDAGDRLFGTH
ncbi:MAG: uracil phosphoribosyltransferase [Ignavibacteria bacterium]|nr:uracil phosphoribosyltransferase [Ignavibacteria bacterium]